MQIARQWIPDAPGRSRRALPAPPREWRDTVRAALLAGVNPREADGVLDDQAGLLAELYAQGLHPVAAAHRIAEACELFEYA